MTTTAARGVPQRRGVHRRRRRPWLRLLLMVTAGLVLIGSGTVIAGTLLVAHYSATVVHRGGLGAAAAPPGHTIDGPLNLLLVGIDERDGNAAAGARADSIIVAHVTAAHDRAYLASVPRDSRVQIPAHPATGYPGGTDKINAAFEFGYRNGGGRAGGLALLAETVSDLTGGRLKFNAAVIVNFDGLRGLVAAVGGVRMYVDERVTSIHVGFNVHTGREGPPFYINPDGTVGAQRPGMRPQVYEVGWHEFSDWQALDYVRQRDLLANQDGDYGRQRHQQQFLRAVLAKTTSTGVLINPVRVAAALHAVGSAVSFYADGTDLADWVVTLHGLVSGGGGGGPSAGPGVGSSTGPAGASADGKVVLVKTNGGRFNPVRLGGIEYEELSADSLQLFDAMAADDVATFVTAHPTWVSS